MIDRDHSMPVTKLLPDFTPSSLGESGDALLNDGGELAGRTNEAADLDLQLFAVNDVDSEQGATVGLVVQPQILDAVEKDLSAYRLIEHHRLPNPFIASAASSREDRPAASSRLNCGDAAEFAAPTGEPERGRFVLDEVAFMSAINPRALDIPSFLRRAPSAHAAIEPEASTALNENNERGIA